MRRVKTEAVILDSSDIFDADRSLLLFSLELGKLRARARGVRRPTSRLTGHLLPYVPTILELTEVSGGWLVTQAQISDARESGTYPVDSLGYLRQAELLSEALNRLYVEMEPHPDVYEGSIYTFSRLRSLFDGPVSLTPQLVSAEFLVKALAELGYRPELARCIVSDEPLNPDELMWSDMLGGVANMQAVRASGVEAYSLRSPRTVVALRELLKPAFSAERLQMPAETVEEVCRIIYGYLQYQIGQPLKALL